MNKLLFEQVTNTLNREVYGIAYSNTHNHFDSEDIVQDVFMRLWEYSKCHSFESLDHLKYWLIRVTVNRCEDYRRQVLRHPVVYLDDIREPEESYEHRDDISKIDALDTKEYQIVFLHYYEGFSYREISQILQISEVAARKRVSRARKALQASRSID